MADHKLSGKDLQVKPFLTQARKIGGRVVQSEIDHPEATNDMDGMEELLAGVDTSEIDAGRERLISENPAMASAQINDMMDDMADDVGIREAAIRENTPKKDASVKRFGKIADRTTGDTINFKRINVGSQVELSEDDGGVLDTLSAVEFDEMLDTGEFMVL